jgi:hypothetical protein
MAANKLAAIRAVEKPIIKKVVHQGYERPKVVEHHQKGRSSRL